MGLNINKVDDEKVCRIFAQHLRSEADRWDKRAENIDREKALRASRLERPLAIRIALRAVVFNHYGMDAMQYCTSQAAKFHLCAPDVQAVYQVYQKKKDDETRLRRNRHILHMSENDGLPYRIIAKKFGITSGTVSKIIDKTRRLDAQKIEPPKRRALPSPKPKPILTSYETIERAMERAAAHYSTA